MRISDWSSDLCSSDLALSLLCAIGARALLRHRVSWAIGLLFMATAATAGALWLDFAGWRAAGLAPQESGQGAVIFALHALQACAVGIGALMAGYCAVRAARGLVTQPQNKRIDLPIVFYGHTARQGAGGASFGRGIWARKTERGG